MKWFNSQKGYGFIQPQGGGKDVFVHISAVERAGLSSLNEGQAIEYEEVSNRGKTSAGRSKGSALIVREKRAAVTRPTRKTENSHYCRHSDGGNEQFSAHRKPTGFCRTATFPNLDESCLGPKRAAPRRAWGFLCSRDRCVSKCALKIRSVSR